MKSCLRITAVVLLLGSLGLWWATGANRGWTKTSVPHKMTDEVTGIEAVTYEKKFVPGVELLGLAAAISAMLAGVSFLFQNKKPGNLTDR
jgi:hypothetical protein